MNRTRLKRMFEKLPPEVQAMSLAFVLAFLRIVYDKKETNYIRITVESLICGLLTLTVYHGIAAVGLNDSWAVCSGGVIGFFGTNTVRMLALQFINKRIK